MRLILLLVAACMAPSVTPVGAAAQVVGELELHELTSRVFGNTRTLRVWLPPGYSEPENLDRRYPVLYLNDGQNLFDAETATFGSREWRADETATGLIRDSLVRPLIIVGIDHGGRRERAREYLPYPDDSLDPPEPDPQGRLYGAFLESEVIPFVERHYRVLPEKENRALGGSSYGALVSLYVAQSRPHLVGGLLLESPSLYVDDSRILRELDSRSVGVDRVYLGWGRTRPAARAAPKTTRSTGRRSRASAPRRTSSAKPVSTHATG